MEWLRQDRLLGGDGLRTLRFTPRRSTVLELARLGHTDLQLSSASLESEAEWETWLQMRKNNPFKNEYNGITLLLGGRRPEGRIPNRQTVSYLPVHEKHFSSIIKAFSIHQSLSTVINRNTSAVFSAECLDDPQNGSSKFVYNCRSSASWTDDLALSATFFPDKNFTHAVIFGCNDDHKKEITERLKTSDCPVFHPLVLPTLFAELERNRQFTIVDKLRTALTTRLLNVAKNNTLYSDAENGSTSSSQRDPNKADSMILWMNFSHLKNGLESWRQQLTEMILHIDELAQNNFGRTSKEYSFDDESSSETLDIGSVDEAVVISDEKIGKHSINDDDLVHLRVAGERIKHRLKELRSEYDEKIRDCATIIEGMTLATQMEWNKIGQLDTKTNLVISNSNLEIATASRNDGKQMRSIAILTMIFLPATFVATIFSMSFFNWHPDGGQGMISPYFWLYPTCTLLLTAITVGTYFTCAWKRKEKHKKDDSVV